ncbi:DUF4212 domain-containing protein [Poriferisphaera sp. WC338]|uniref:DUF4212 domain-containing protein n=1 Tax=Poriferisphaera sp. WC338 TaxID=3425129 RepID=UPI003D814802
MAEQVEGRAHEEIDAPDISNTQTSSKTKLDYNNPKVVTSIQKYWEANIRVMGILLLIWAAVGLGCGILFADWLNQFNFPGTGAPLGFWFAQQGSIIVFVFLILVYAIIMNRLDAYHQRELKNLHEQDGGDA